MNRHPGFLYATIYSRSQSVSRMDLHDTHTWYVETATDHRPCPPFTIYVPSLRASLDLTDLLADQSLSSCPLSNLRSRSRILWHNLKSFDTVIQKNSLWIYNTLFLLNTLLVIIRFLCNFQFFGKSLFRNFLDLNRSVYILMSFV